MFLLPILSYKMLLNRNIGDNEYEWTEHGEYSFNINSPITASIAIVGGDH